jgi:hypothetical protein
MNHKAKFRVEKDPRDPQRTTIFWQATFDAKGVAADDATKKVIDIFAAGLNGIKRKVLRPEGTVRGDYTRPMPRRSILITGCSSGIGLCAAQTLKVRGWRVFATARKAEDIARLKDEVGVESLYLDYAEPASIAAAAEHVLKSQPTASSMRCSTMAGTASPARSRISDRKCSAPSSRPMSSAGMISPGASFQRCALTAKAGSYSAPRCSG